MANKDTVSVHWSFWVIGVVALIWNIMGVMNFFSQMNPDMVATMPESYRAIIESRPLWATGGFAIAVFGGVIGCFLLLFRKSVAYYLFIASLVGALIQMPPWLGMASATIGLGSFLIVAVFLIWYTKKLMKKGLIR